MNKISIWVSLISIFLLLHKSKSTEEDVKQALVNFLGKLSNNNEKLSPNLNWNMSTDPCKDQWKGIRCDTRSTSVKWILLDSYNLVGTFDAGSLCNVQSLSTALTVLSLNDNNISGEIPDEISNCKQLTHLYLSRNKFSGILPESLSVLHNLKRLDISNNKLSGKLPNLPHISGMIAFLAQNNQLTGEIPKFDFSNFVQFNVSFNNFSGPIPDVKGRFPESSFIGNPDLCGEPLQKKCPPSSPDKKKSKNVSDDDCYDDVAGYADP